MTALVAGFLYWRRTFTQENAHRSRTTFQYRASIMISHACVTMPEDVADRSLPSRFRRPASLVSSAADLRTIVAWTSLSQSSLVFSTHVSSVPVTPEENS